MTPKRILMVMVEPPLPFGNAAGRWYYVLMRELQARGHRVTAFAACSKAEDVARATRLFPAPDYDLRAYPFPTRRGLVAKLDTLRRPYSYMFSEELKKDLGAELAKGFDVLHLETLSSGWLGLGLVDRCLLNVHFLYDIDLEEVQVAPWQRFMMHRAEHRLLRSYPRVNVLSDRMARRVRRIDGRAEVSITPLGIDPTLYPYIPDERRDVGPVVTVIGSMNWYPTHSAAVRLLSDLWPRIKQSVPAARVEIVGWGARTALREYLDMPDVTIVEDVIEIQPYFERAGVLLYAPRRGSGMKIKVLESFLYGIPVVTTTEGVEGIPAEDGVHAGICDDDEGLIRRTVELLLDQDLSNRRREAARRLAEARCGPGPTVDAFEALYGRISTDAESRSPVERAVAR